MKPSVAIEHLQSRIAARDLERAQAAETARAQRQAQTDAVVAVARAAAPEFQKCIDDAIVNAGVPGAIAVRRTTPLPAPPRGRPEPRNRLVIPINHKALPSPPPGIRKFWNNFLNARKRSPAIDIARRTIQEELGKQGWCVHWLPEQSSHIEVTAKDADVHENLVRTLFRAHPELNSANKRPSQTPTRGRGERPRSHRSVPPPHNRPATGLLPLGSLRRVAPLSDSPAITVKGERPSGPR
jgi:hypothetical protein